MIMQTPQTSPSIGPSRERGRGDGAGAQAPRRRESDRHPQGTPDHAPRLALGLGWFSLGFGVAQVATPRAFARMIGVRSNRRNRTVMRVIGACEIAAGLGLLTRSRPADRLWARAPQVTKAITVNRPPEELYQFWRDLENLPRFMNHLDSVKRGDEGRFHWIAKTPIGTTLEWDAEILEDRPNEFLAWRSLDGAKVASSGSVRFERAPGGRGTEVHVEIGYQPTGGVLGAAVAGLFGKGVAEYLAADLRRFKQLMETGEVVTSDQRRKE